MTVTRPKRSKKTKIGQNLSDQEDEDIEVVEDLDSEDEFIPTKDSDVEMDDDDEDDSTRSKSRGSQNERHSSPAPKRMTRGSKKNPETPKKSKPKTSFERGTEVLKTTSTKVVNKRKIHGSIAIQIATMAGSNVDKISRIINSRDYWEYPMFIPPKEIAGIGMESPSYEHNNPAKLPDTYSTPESSNKANQFTEISIEDASKYIIKSAPEGVNINSQLLKPFEAINTLEEEFNEFDGMILNAGGVITSLAWAKGQPDPQHQYLAVGVLDDNNRHPIDSPIVTQDISAFSTTGYPSSFYIYHVDLSVDPEKNDLGYSRVKLFYTVSSEFGSTIKLEWRPIVSDQDIGPNSLGYLAVLNQDGKLRVYDMPLPKGGLQDPKHYIITRPYKQYELPNNESISEFCWRTSDTLVVGGVNGQLAEYDITDNDPDFGNQPSYYLPIFDSLISKIVSCYPNNPDILIVFSTNGYSCMFDTRIPENRILNSRRKGFSVSSVYCPHYESIIVGEDYGYAKSFYLRFFKTIMHSNSLTHHNSQVLSLAVSNYHPFILSGSADGTVIVGNIMRRLLGRKRSAKVSYEQGILWGLDYSLNDGKYLLKNIFQSNEIQKPKTVNITQTYPHNVTIKDICWSTCKNSCEYYAAGSTSGIIRIHRLFMKEE